VFASVTLVDWVSLRVASALVAPTPPNGVEPAVMLDIVDHGVRFYETALLISVSTRWTPPVEREAWLQRGEDATAREVCQEDVHGQIKFTKPL
jgi:hypothetical protein